MAKRRVVDKPDRGRGWYNGRYTKAKVRNRSEGDNYYYWYCPECDEDTPHEYDECIKCTGKEDAGGKQK